VARDQRKLAATLAADAVGYSPKWGATPTTEIAQMVAAAVLPCWERTNCRWFGSLLMLLGVRPWRQPGGSHAIQLRAMIPRSPGSLPARVRWIAIARSRSPCSSQGNEQRKLAVILGLTLTAPLIWRPKGVCNLALAISITSACKRWG
jgi:hypothetical protein